MTDPAMMNDDLLSLSMFWAGALMVFTPLVCGAVVLGVWWRQRVRARGRSAEGAKPLAGDATISSPRPR
jgi:hypothetical protein